MNVVLAMVATINGKITKGNDPDIYTWTSKEDQAHFFSLIQQHNLIVMGSATYEAVLHRIKLNPHILRIVVTGNPEKYEKEEVEGQLEFYNTTPLELIKTLEKKGYTKMLLVGGGTINALFFKDNLIDEIYLTIEPKIFTRGKSFIDTTIDGADISLRLKNIKQINVTGTLLLHYEVLR